MKTGMTLQQLATEIERQRDTKRDLVVSTQHIEMQASDEQVDPALVLDGKERLAINPLAHQQLADFTGIGKSYYDRMLEKEPELLAQNVNTWLHRDPQPRLIRTIDGAARAVLSDRYRPLDYAEMGEAILPILLEHKLVIASCQITERRLYIKAFDQRIKKDMPVGSQFGRDHHIFHTMSPALTVSNSEVGCGALSVQTGVVTHQCTNLATFSEQSMRKYHTGAKHALTDGINMALLSDQTRRLTDAAIWSQARDVVVAALDEGNFNKRLEQIQGLSSVAIEGDPVKVLKLTGDRFGFNEGEKTSILKHLIEGGDLSAYGLFNAVTRTAEDLPDYDRATEFEGIGGKLIELPKSEWRELAKAA